MDTKTFPSWNELSLQLIQDLHYSDITLQRVRYTYNIFVRDFCHLEGNPIQRVNNGIKEASIAYQNTKISKDKLLRLRRVAYRLLMLIECNQISWERIPKYRKVSASSKNEMILQAFLLDNKNKHAISINYRDEGIIRQFLIYLEEQKSKDIKTTNIQDILGFLKYMKQKRPAGLTSTVSAMKHFFDYLIDRGIIPENLKRALKSWDTPHKKIYGIFSTEEKEKILSSIDRNLVIGKRDYAIFSLASDCGIRSSDICSLKLTDINWRDSSISIMQAKTTKPVSIPFSTRTGNALSEYILNARGDTSLPYVFIKVSYFDTKMTAPLLCCRLKKCLVAASIYRDPRERIGMHTFRRSLGTELINAGNTLELTAQVLGHTDTTITKSYISFSDNALRECALDLSLIPALREVHYD